MGYILKQVDAEQLENLKKLFVNVYHENAQALIGMEERFNTSHFGASVLGFVAYPEEQILDNGVEVPASYYGVFPQIAIEGNSRILCAQSGDTMTHKAHRGKGLFVKLANLTNDLAREKGVELIYGFPSPMTYPGFKNKLGWHFPYNMLKFNRFVPTIPIGILKRRLKFPIGGLGRVSRYLNRSSLHTPNSIQSGLFNDLNEGFTILRNQDYWNYKTQCVRNKWIVNHQGIFTDWLLVSTLHN